MLRLHAPVLCLSLSLPLLAQVPRGGFDEARLPAIASLLRAEVDNGHHAGLSFLVLHRGSVVAEGAFGSADLGRGAPMARDTIVRLYSMTKAVTAVAALTLVERNVLRLDSRVTDFVPELKALQVWDGGTAEDPLLVPVKTQMTVRMLLNHTAGFSYDFYDDMPLHDLYRRADLWGAATLDDFVQRVARLPLRTQPGAAWHYSISDDVLGVVIERASGQPFADYVRNTVTGPLRMVDTDFDVPEQKRGRLAGQHRRVDGKLATTEPSFGAFAEPGRGFASGGAGLFSTLDDYARFARFLAGDGSLDGARVLSRKTMDLARSDSLRSGPKMDRPGDSWNLVCALRADPGAASDPCSEGMLHWSGAATTTFFVDPAEEVVALMFAQHFPYDEHRIITRFRTAVMQAVR